MTPELPDYPFLRTDIELLGISPKQLRTLLREGTLRRPMRGVYVRADLPDTQELRVQCAKLVLPPHAVVSDRSAAWIHGIDCFDPAHTDIPPELEVVSIDGHDRSRRPELLGGKRTLRPDDICEVKGVLVTTPLRTAGDLACRHGRYGALAVLDAFMRRYGLTHVDFQRMVHRFFRRRGVIQLRELVNYACGLAESPGESWTRMAIIDAGLPTPRPQVWVTLPGYGRVRLDLAYERLKIAVEYNGEEFHTSDEDREADEKRREALEKAGWIVIVVTKSDFTAEALDAWLGRLRDAIEERRPVAKRRYSRGESWDRRTR